MKDSLSLLRALPFLVCFLTAVPSQAALRDVFRGEALLESSETQVVCRPQYGWNDPLILFDRNRNFVRDYYLDRQPARFIVSSKPTSVLRLKKSYRCSLSATKIIPPRGLEFSSARQTYYFYSPDDRQFWLYVLNVEKLKGKKVSFKIYSPSGKKAGDLTLREVRNHLSGGNFSAYSPKDVANECYPRVLPLQGKGYWRIEVFPFDRAKYGIWLEGIPNVLSTKDRFSLPEVKPMRFSYKIGPKVKTDFGVVGNRGYAGSEADKVFETYHFYGDKVYLHSYRSKLEELAAREFKTQTCVVLLDSGDYKWYFDKLLHLKRPRGSFWVQVLNQPNLYMSASEYARQLRKAVKYARDLPLMNGGLGTDESPDLIDYQYLYAALKSVGPRLSALSINMYRLEDADSLYLLKKAHKRLEDLEIDLGMAKKPIVIGEFNRAGGLQNPEIFEGPEFVTWLASAMIHIAEAGFDYAYYFKYSDQGYRKKGLFTEEGVPKPAARVFSRISRLLHEGIHLLSVSNKSLCGLISANRILLVNPTNRPVKIPKTFVLLEEVFGEASDSKLSPYSIAVFKDTI